MRTLALLLCSLLSGCFPCLLHAEEADTTMMPPPKTVPVTVNWGVKAGFTAALSFINDFSIGGTPVKEVQNNYRVGYLAAVFMRINFGRHFLQTEASYNVNNCDITFTKPLAEAPPLGTQTGERSSISSQIYSFDIPVLYGYNFIKQGAYHMAVFAGPKIRLLWREKSDISFQNFDETDLKEELYPMGVSFTVGTSVTISPIFFDFRYDIGMLNLTKQLSGNEVHYERRDNVLSFSLGIFF